MSGYVKWICTSVRSQLQKKSRAVAYTKCEALFEQFQTLLINTSATCRLKKIPITTFPLCTNIWGPDNSRDSLRCGPCHNFCDQSDWITFRGPGSSAIYVWEKGYLRRTHYNSQAFTRNFQKVYVETCLYHWWHLQPQYINLLQAEGSISKVWNPNILADSQRSIFCRSNHNLKRLEGNEKTANIFNFCSAQTLQVSITKHM